MTHGVVGEQNGQKRNGHRNITEEVKNLILVDDITDQQDFVTFHKASVSDC